MRSLWHSFCSRWQIAVDFCLWIGRRRPWMLPLLLGLFFIALFVSFAQATHIAPFIYTLF